LGPSSGVGPVYVVQPYINVPFGKAITLALVLPFTNEFVSQSATERNAVGVFHQCLRHHGDRVAER